MWTRRESRDYLSSCIQMTWVLCGESEEDLKVTVERFVVLRTRGGVKGDGVRLIEGIGM